MLANIDLLLIKKSFLPWLIKKETQSQKLIGTISVCKSFNFLCRVDKRVRVAVDLFALF